jgi:hypothetical protein
MTEAERINKVLAEAAKQLGVNVEDLGVTADELAANQTLADQVGEAQAVLYYMEYKGEGFDKKPCVSCGRTFAYAWDRTAITCCSVECLSAELEKKGLSWKINRPLHLRWGRTAPMILPPDVLNLADSLLVEATDSQEDQLPDTSFEESVLEQG